MNKPKKPYTKAFERAAFELVTIRKAEWLTTNQVARWMQISPSSIEKARSTGDGPLATLPYRKIGRCVRYARSDVLAFLDKMVVQGRRSPSPKNGS